MVVVDYSISERYCRTKHNLDNDQKQQQMQQEEAAADAAMSNFCPRLRSAVRLLSRHKVGLLQQQVRLTDFQSSSTPTLQTNCLSSSTIPTPPRNDGFVLAIPYFYNDTSVSSGHNMVRWSIIAQCRHPDRSPEVILLGIDDPSIGLGHGDASLRRQRVQHLHRRQTHQITQEHYWQQYVTSDLFYVPCLSKWNKMSNENSSVMQFCTLADQLYECYAQFQVYKLKMSLKSTPSVQPTPQLTQAYTQYKQLAKLSKPTIAESDTIATSISVEVLVELEGGVSAKEYEDRRKQGSPSILVHMRAVISMVPLEETASTSSTPETTNQDYFNKLLHLASITTTFPHSTVSSAPSNKNPPTSSNNTNNNLNKRYTVKILHPKLDNTTHQGTMMSTMLDAATEPFLDTSIFDFVTYVRRVQHAAIQSYNCEVSSSDEEKPSPDEDDDEDNTVNFLLQSLNETFCHPSSSSSCLIDYQINSFNPLTKSTSSFIRYLLVDEDIATETTLLKYILSIECDKEIIQELRDTTENTDQTKNEKLVPVIVTLRSVYDDESCEHNLNINAAGILAEADKNHVKYDELATLIKTAAINGMQQYRHRVLTPVLTRYNKQWSPSDPYFVCSLQKSPPYQSP